MDKKLYAVYYYNSSYSSYTPRVRLAGIYDTREDAIDRINDLIPNDMSSSCNNSVSGYTDDRVYRVGWMNEIALNKAMDADVSQPHNSILII